MELRKAAFFLIVLAAASAARAQAIPKWEVASIRLCEGDATAGGKRGGGPGAGGGPPTMAGGHLTMACQPLQALIQTAYGRFAGGHMVPGRPASIEGVPGWAKSDRFQINAKAEVVAGQKPPTQEMMRGPMLQALLEERFQLKVRYDTREVPVYELSVAGKSAPKLTPFKEGSCVPFDFEHPLPPPEQGQPFPRGCSMIMSSPEAMNAYGVTLPEFCLQLSNFLDRSVIDKTGITGRYDVTIQGDMRELFPNIGGRGGRGGPGGRGGGLSPDGGADATPSDPASPGIFAALKAIGLKLSSGKGPGRFLVVERVEKLTAN